VPPSPGSPSAGWTGRSILSALSPGHSYDPAATSFVRLNFGTGEELLTEMLSRMSEAIG
jgi:bifunctional pyridoxal-dependent enzyme with beta-cystathionase and maltose regulon repressor activities